MMRLEAADIYAGYGKIEVLHGATLRAAAGEIVCIIGPNGSGKSTLLKTVFGLLKPTKGTVSFDGKDITRLEPEQKVHLGIAFIPQGRNVFPSLTVRENLEMGGTALDDEKAVQRAIEEALASYPLLK
ncbi:MAG TPA: ATP-binding cassette domain-containing protein, partial [Methanomicrobiales archaeon]|nr:ATP-binding cassette domain-containing protein [Methanomicrobiales archaeon]